MSVLYYSAIDADGVLHHGRRQAESPEALATELERHGMTLLRSRVSVLARFTRFNRQPRTGFDSARLSLASFQLAHLLRAGVPLLDAIDELIALEHHAGRRTVLERVRRRIDNGCNLSAALAPMTDVFGSRYIAMVQAGEASGRLAGCLMTLEASLRREADTRTRLHNLMIYPALAGMLVLATTVFLFAWVVPQLAGTLDAGEGELPLATRAVLSVSAGVAAHGWSIVMVLAALVVPITIVGLGHATGRHVLHRLLLSAGSVARLHIELSVSRYSECVALLYGNGVALIRALEIAEPLVGNAVLRAELIDVRRRIVAGSNVGEALSAARWLPGTLKRLVAAGESAGALDAALQQAGEQLRMSARHGADRIEQVLPGAVLLVVGGLLLLVIVSVILPVYDTLSMATQG